MPVSTAHSPSTSLSTSLSTPLSSRQVLAQRQRVLQNPQADKLRKQQILRASEMREAEPQQAGERWEDMWRGGIDPGERFDGGRIAPFLAAKLSRGDLNVAGKTCLVPGCGRGYDCLAFAKAGASKAIGLELSPTAVKRATEHKANLGLDHDLAARSSYQQADFFEFPTANEDSFDFGYDYTFLCAMQPTQREAWAKTWAALIAPGGQLLTMMFPVDSERKGGPPFAVTPELYEQLLVPTGFEKVSVEKVPDDMSHNGRGGKEYYGVWRRTRQTCSL